MSALAIRGVQREGTQVTAFTTVAQPPVASWALPGHTRRTRALPRVALMLPQVPPLALPNHTRRLWLWFRRARVRALPRVALMLPKIQSCPQLDQ